jgi:transcriptional regulator with GAF, ATPase, and Fis domain/pSer/pThr/pTyr-binding forkhead associated (FHA) protein
MVESGFAISIRLLVTDGAGGPPSKQVFAGPVVQVGRGPGNNLQFEDTRVSSVHGRIVMEGDRVRYQDLGSTNGSAVLRKGKRTAVHKDAGPGVELTRGDEILLGDAERPSCIRLEEITTRAGARPAVSEATVVAQRALGVVTSLPEGETLARLLSLLAGLRTESDTFSLTRRVLDFLIAAVPGASRAECFMKDTTGRFAAVLAMGPEGTAPVATPPASKLIGRLQETRETVLIHDTQDTPDSSASIRTMPSRSVLLAPLICDQELVGAIQVGSKLGGVFTDRELDLAAVLAQQLSAVLSGARLIERLTEAEARLQGECEYLKERLGHRPALEEMVGSSPGIAPSRTTILIQGETGVGKELVARAVHEQSPRKNATFAAVNCSALAPGLLESELFGHKKGAFTGAHRDRQGLFEVAHQGTLFLDEIGDMPAALQPKLLRCLEQGTILPVGSTKPKQVNVRVVAASNRNLEEEVQAGRFRQDLLFRLNVFTMQVPPLRERRQDILPIAKIFLDRFSAEHNRKLLGFTPEAIAALEGYDWPGNIRELRNEIERATLLAPQNGPVDRAHFSERLGGGQDLVGPVQGTLKDVMDRLESVVLQAALKRHDGNRTQCAKSLGISRQALIAKIARFGLE